MERLGPSHPDSVAEWDKLTAWERGLYVNCVERLFEERELIDRALKIADNDMILGTAEERE